MKLLIMITISLSLSLFTNISYAEKESPEDLVASINKLLINENKTKDDISEILDFNYITKISFNRYLRKMNEKEKESAKKVTKKRVLMIYEKSLKVLSDKEIVLNVQKIKYNRSKKKVIIKLDSEESNDVSVYAVLKKDSWKIYDLGFNGLRFSRAIRDDIKQEINATSIDDVIKEKDVDLLKI
jgi:ABC-type transporter MlaC component